MRDVGGSSCRKCNVFPWVAWVRRLPKVGFQNRDANKFCTTPARENDLEIKIVQNRQGRRILWFFDSWGSKILPTPTRDSESEFKMVFEKFAPCLRGERLGSSKRVSVEGTGTSCFVMSKGVFLDAESVENLQISCLGTKGSFHKGIKGICPS